MSKFPQVQRGRPAQDDDGDEIPPLAAALDEGDEGDPDADAAFAPQDRQGDGDDDNYRRTERAYAKQAGQWVCDPLNVITDITVALTATAGTMHYMYFLMQGQSLLTWQGHYGLKAVPLIQYARAYRSPSVRTYHLESVMFSDIGGFRI
jgi:hypothetical protein